MPVFNYAGQEISAKIVYYGPGLSGKTTNLECIYARLPRENKGKMVSMKTRTDRTLFFDFLPIDIGEIGGMKVRFLLYTVPGQVYYNATRKLVLKGVDAVVFVADSAPDRLQDNKESLANLEENLNDLGLSLREIPWAIQLNKRDLTNAMDRKLLERELNTLSVPCFEAVASKGEGVYETFEGIAKIVFARMQRSVKNLDGAVGKGISRREEKIDVEIVAKGKGVRNSETGRSDYRYSAEKREEEQKSVSEFIDNKLCKQNDLDVGVDLGATRSGYEEYGHTVELSNGKNSSSFSHSKEGSYEEPARVREIENEDTLESISRGVRSKEAEDIKAESNLQPAGAKSEISSKSASKIEPSQKKSLSEEKTIRVPIRLSRSDASKEIQLNVLIEIEVD